jgi:hypothetical protein
LLLVLRQAAPLQNEQGFGSSQAFSVWHLDILFIVRAEEQAQTLRELISRLNTDGENLE